MSKIYLHGDTHGGCDADNLQRVIFTEQEQLSKDDVLIVLGDFGYFWNEKDFNTNLSTDGQYKVNKLVDRKFQACFIDGNHENFNILEKLEQGKKWGGKVGIYRADSGNVIYHLKRGEIYTINGKKILTIGGAYSIDKQYRKNQVSWWPQETINKVEIQNTLDNLDKHNWCVDVVLTHTCPSHIGQHILETKPLNEPNVRFFDQLLEKNLKFDEWHFGHFHENRQIEDKFWCHFYESPYRLV